MRRRAIGRNLTRGVLCVTLLALAPLHQARAGGGSVQVTINGALRYRAQGLTYRDRDRLYIGVDSIANGVWTLNPADNSQTWCMAPSTVTGLATPVIEPEQSPFVDIPAPASGKIWQVDPLTCAGQVFASPTPLPGTLGAAAFGPGTLLWTVLNNTTMGQSWVVTIDTTSGAFGTPVQLPGGPVMDIKRFGGSMFVTNVGKNELEQVDPTTMAVTRYPMPGSGGFGTLGGWIADGCGDTLWFTYGSYLAAFRASHVYLFDPPFTGMLPSGIALDSYENPWFGLLGTAGNKLAMIDVGSIPSDFSTATFNAWDIGTYRIGEMVSIGFPRLLAPRTRGIAGNPPQPFQCPSPVLAGQVFDQGSSTGMLGTYTGYDQGACPSPTGVRGLIPSGTALIRGLNVRLLF